MSRIVTALLIGLMFGAGIALSGMIDPAKVLNFFDIAGSWDPSLAFVMGGALIVTAIGYRLVLKRPAPLLDTRFHLPARKDIDLPLLAGAGLGEPAALIFVASMVCGIAATRLVRR
jgi:uncharacterized membrane protein YedE/YeeE